MFNKLQTDVIKMYCFFDNGRLKFLFPTFTSSLGTNRFGTWNVGLSGANKKHFSLWNTTPSVGVVSKAEGDKWNNNTHHWFLTW